MHGHACVHSVPKKTLLSWYRLAKRNDFDVSGNVKNLDEMIFTNIFIYKQDIQHSEADKALGSAGCGLISQAEKSFFSIACRLSYCLGVMFKDLSIYLQGERNQVYTYGLYIITPAIQWTL